MASKEKLMAKMRINPRGWRISQLESVAAKYGIFVRKSGGSHVVFSHPETQRLLSVPAKRPIKPIYIKKFVALIELVELNDEKTRVPLRCTLLN